VALAVGVVAATQPEVLRMEQQTPVVVVAALQIALLPVTVVLA
jgi:hypothetical protein